MVKYSAHEYIDMIIAYGASGGNSRAACRLYAERFPERGQPSCSVILNCIQRLRETGSVCITRQFVTGKVYSRKEEKILRAYEDNPQKSVRNIARLFGVSRSCVYRILERNEVLPNRDEKHRDIYEDDLHWLYSERRIQ
ncbi:PREDICTED: uncharacterized protein LOC108781049 [Cyphomyrmex costatus]|uniref:DUF4817 domain-containing protein n=1 Tax=Cyphomyrmex costatus TaxID=456900 RepID=A0A151I8H3_9HYME|nr:PREDICTED: uncharacterized protein LOC108781049 [Cyphomyrmex costatus]KYM94742.1 hypothetical protein ALC62_14620 [Cyphomyrmex costatus]